MNLWCSTTTVSILVACSPSKQTYWQTLPGMPPEDKHCMPCVFFNVTSVVIHVVVDNHELLIYLFHYFA
jgi:hypothetical protein